MSAISPSRRNRRVEKLTWRDYPTWRVEGKKYPACERRLGATAPVLRPWIHNRLGDEREPTKSLGYFTAYFKREKA